MKSLCLRSIIVYAVLAEDAIEVAMEEFEHLRKTLEHYRQQRQQKLEEVRAIETMIRQLELDLGEPATIEAPPLERDVAPAMARPISLISPLHSLRPDEFFAMSQSDAAKAYLRLVGHAITFDELVEALRKGGAKLGGADPKKTLYVSLARNPRKEFVWPSKEHIGLKEFYDRKDRD